jgi:probable F420-dependent oxidoreductase
MAAAVTTRIRLGTSVCLVAQHDPLWLAKQISTLDHLSGGRVVLGVGYGWNREEAANHGVVDWGARREIVREKVEAMRALWTQEVASYEGAHVRIARSWMWPKPAQPGGPRVLLGGGFGPKLLREVAAWADGWMPITARPTFAGRVEALRDACARVGRDSRTVELVAVGASADVESLASLRAEGVHRALLTVWDEDEADALRTLDRFASVLDELG